MGGKEVINIPDVPLDSLSFYARTERHSKNSTCMRDKCHQLYSGNGMESFKREKGARRQTMRIFSHRGEKALVPRGYQPHHKVCCCWKKLKNFANNTLMDCLSLTRLVFSLLSPHSFFVLCSTLFAKYRYAKQRLHMAIPLFNHTKGNRLLFIGGWS